jgi:hypothetical protein
VLTGNADLVFTGTGVTGTGSLNMTDGKVTYQAGGDIIRGTYNDLQIDADAIFADGMTTINGNAAFTGEITDVEGSVITFNGTANSGTLNSIGSVIFTTDSVLSGTYNNLAVAGQLGAAEVVVNGIFGNIEEGTLSGNGILTLNGTVANITAVEGNADGYLSVTYGETYASEVLSGEFANLNVNGTLEDADVTIYGILNCSLFFCSLCNNLIYLCKCILRKLIKRIIFVVIIQLRIRIP